MIVDLLALGLDPEAATLFVQSDVPETTELAWLLTSVTPMSWLEKCVSYKDKVQQGIPAEHGLFAYPVLQAADILLYDADVVPVGQDQKQHLESDPRHRPAVQPRLRRDVQTPQTPHPCRPWPSFQGSMVEEDVQELPTTRSRSSTTRRSILKKCKKIVTDSTPVESPKVPETDPLFQLFQLFAPDAEVAEVDARYRSGGIGYGEVKTRLAEHIANRFADARDRRADLVAHPERVREVRQAAAIRAKAAARVVLDRARNACGVG